MYFVTKFILRGEGAANINVSFFARRDNVVLSSWNNVAILLIYIVTSTCLTSYFIYNEYMQIKGAK